MENMYIITGANGFLGNNIIRQLNLAGNDRIRALVLPDDDIKSLQGLRCEIYYGDVTKKETLDKIFEDTENYTVFVIHCAGIVYIKTKFIPQVYDVNVNGTKNIIDKVLQINAKLIYVSSVHAVTEKPDGMVMTEMDRFEPDKVVGQYAKTKAETGNYVLDMVKQKNLNACIVQPSGMIGPYDFGSSHLTQLILDMAARKLKAGVKGGYDFVDVRDVACGIIKACEYGRSGQCYLLSNKYIKVDQLLDIISDVMHYKKIKSTIPMWIAKLTAPMAELYYSILKQPPLYTKYSLYTLSSNANFSNEKAKKELKFVTRDIKDTVSDTVIWLEQSKRITLVPKKSIKIKKLTKQKASNR